MKKKKTWISIALLFVAAFFIIGPTGENFKNHIFTGILSILVGVLIVAGVVLAWLSRLGVKVKPEKQKKTPAPSSAATGAEEADEENDESIFLPTGTYRYEYEAVNLFRPEDECDVLPDLGSNVDLETEPENPYDSGAVKAVYGGGLVGYLNKGKLQDMMRDKLNRGEDICAILTRGGKRPQIWIGVD